jgi:hypothetical protein
MHLHQQRGPRVDGVGVVRGMRAIGGADLDEFCAGAAHHVGNAERPADLHQFAARHHHLAPVGQRIQHQQDRRGVVVHHRRRRGAGQFAKQRLDQGIAVAAAAAAQVVFQIDRRTERLHHRVLHFEPAAPPVPDWCAVPCPSD